MWNGVYNAKNMFGLYYSALYLKHKANIMKAGHDGKVDKQTLQCSCVCLIQHQEEK